MNFFEKIIYGLSGTMPEPTVYGWFHFMFVAIVIIATVILCVFCRNCSVKTFKIITLIVWIIMLVFEIYKQLLYSFNYENGKVKWEYEWKQFPFQLCSTPLYVLPFIIFSRRDGHVRDACVAFITTFSLFGGLVTFIYPSTVFIDTIGINIQTMTHHGLQIVLGIFFVVYYRKRLNIKFFLKGTIVFGITFVIALVLNFIVHAVTPDSFSMFYISPYFPCDIPLLSIIYDKTPYVVFLLIYIVGFMLAGLVLYYIQYGIIKGTEKIKEKREKTQKI